MKMGHGKSSKLDSAWKRDPRSAERRMARGTASKAVTRGGKRAQRQQDRAEDRVWRKHNPGRLPTVDDYSHMVGLLCAGFCMLVYVLW